VLKGFDATAIESAVANATGLKSIKALPVPTQGCGCPDAAAGVVAASCSATCSDGSSPATYVNISAEASYTWLVPYPGVGNPVTLTSKSVVRIK
jgi:hypothetical protein